MTSSRKPETRSGILVAMPPALKQAVVDRVEQRGGNMNDVCVKILARHYDEPFTPSSKQSEPGKDKLKVLLRMDSALKDKIVADAVDRRSNQSDTCVRILCGSLRVKHGIPAKGRRTVPFGGGRGRTRALATTA